MRKMILAADRALLEKYEFAVSISRKGDENEASVKVEFEGKLPFNRVFHPRLIQALIDAIKKIEGEVAGK